MCKNFYYDEGMFLIIFYFISFRVLNKLDIFNYRFSFNYFVFFFKKIKYKMEYLYIFIFLFGYKYCLNVIIKKF